MKIENKVKAAIRDIPNFPKAGIVFKDIMPILENPVLTNEITEDLFAAAQKLKVDAVMGIESRGFFWGLLLAQKLGVPFIPVRKKGKLPYKTVAFQYELEYGAAEIEVHQDVIQPNANILIHDDLLATGGTAAAAAEIVKMEKANVIGFSFLITLDFLKGKDRLKSFTENIYSLVSY